MLANKYPGSIWSAALAAFLTVPFFASVCSCQRAEPAPLDPFGELYAKFAPLLQDVAATQTAAVVRVTRSYKDATMYQIMRDFAELTGRSVVISESAEKHTVTAEFRGEPAEVALGAIARRIGAQLAITGSAYYVGELQSQDRAILVRTVPRLSQAQAASVVSVYLSESGRVATTEDGLLVLGDKLEVVERISRMLDMVEAAPNETWVVQAFIVQASDDAKASVGVDATTVAQIAAVVGNAAAVPSGIQALGRLDASFKAVLSAGESRLLMAPMMLISEGQAGQIKSGTNVLLSTGTTQTNGSTSSTTTGFQSVPTGTDIKFQVRRVDQDQAKLQVDIVLGQLLSVDPRTGAPTTSSDELHTFASIRSGGVYLVGSLAQSSALNAVTGPLALQLDKSKSAKRLDIWLRTYRITGATRAAPTVPPQSVNTWSPLTPGVPKTLE